MTLEERLERLENYLGIDDEPEILTVIDPDTGLEWERYGSVNKVNWVDTFDYRTSLNQMNFAGHSDWRIPSRFELESLLNLDEFNPCIKNIPDIQHFSDIYWSSTAYVSITGFVWTVNFYNGGVGGDSTINSFYVRLVRGGKG